MKICTYNVCMHFRGYNQTRNDKKLERGREIVAWLRAEKFDVVCLQEVWYEPFISSLRRLCDIYPVQFRSKKLGCIWHSGLYVLSRVALSQDEFEFSAQGNFWQSCVPRTFMVMKTEGAVIVNAHLTSPEFYNDADEHRAVIDQQMQEILEKVDEKRGKKDNWYICADFNHEVGEITSLNCDSHLNDTKMKSCVRQNRVDNIINNCQDSHVISLPYSDHFPVICDDLFSN